MASRKRVTSDWRSRATSLAAQLDRAHCAVEALSAALEEGNGTSVKDAEDAAHEAVEDVARSVKSFKAEQPFGESDGLDGTGSTVAIGGAGVATVSLDVMVKSMVALASTTDLDETDYLVSAGFDAENAYEVGVAVVGAAPNSDESGMVDLERALSTAGYKALTKRVTQARPRILAIQKQMRVL